MLSDPPDIDIDIDFAAADALVRDFFDKNPAPAVAYGIVVS